MPPVRFESGLIDMRPNAQIVCLRCSLAKPQTGSVKFHAHLVCADCTKLLQTLDRKEKP